MSDPASETSSDRLDSLSYCRTRYREVRPRLAFGGLTGEQVAGWRGEARRKLVELIGPLPDDKVALDPRYGEEVRRPGYRRRMVTFATRPGLLACGYLLIPDGLDLPAPAIVCIPGHGRGVDEIVGIDERGKDRDYLDGYQHDFAVQCVRQGYVTLALEPIGFGRRRDPAARARGAGASSCQPAAGAALLLGETMVGWRVWDAFRALDLLETRSEVDRDRLAMMGISGGGTVILYAAALDERVKASVLSGSFCTFKDSIYSVSHCIDNYVPGLLGWFEAADVAGLIAPRLLFCEAGTDDPIFPEAGVKAALREAERIFEASGAEARVGHAFFRAGHSFDGVAAFRWLKGRL